ncbi:hypothetical protein LIER_21560 [Lithospermum erythrorhizon]|uniref:Uncharacterized protein n=1 Tax=Lithospermum erythrorhizon TaxID=34254 RepID=A0AAV3QRW6_LITER
MATLLEPPHSPSKFIQSFPGKPTNILKLYSHSHVPNTRLSGTSEAAEAAPVAAAERSKERRKVVRVAWEKLVRWSRSLRSKAKTDVLERTKKAKPPKIKPLASEAPWRPYHQMNIPTPMHAESRDLIRTTDRDFCYRCRSRLVSNAELQIWLQTPQLIQ